MSQVNPEADSARLDGHRSDGELIERDREVEQAVGNAGGGALLP
eukprot:CAMPEP_0171951942 /NCGR_PEP_ID=MMETSP0993-20121228/87020_1 /TAXON_ID=483369 /ORGANISM="non described non described, Strain CCMP2098" /LENGTH=43 /DNA_ID= /DNA_START= /DNA_END= /DNA_ORIENTATION=